MLFSRSVLLVEGEGDRQLFERLRRRLAQHDPSGRVDEMLTVPVGGKRSFAPWIQLLNSFDFRGEKPINWLIAADGDGVSDVRTAFSHAGITVPANVLQAIGTSGQERSNGVEAWRRALRQLNVEARKVDLAMCFLPVDLEDAALGNASEATLGLIAHELEIDGSSLSEVLRALGSKGVDSPQDGKKNPWIRGEMGGVVPPTEISADLKGIILRWLEGVMSRREALALFRRFEAGGDPLTDSP